MMGYLVNANWLYEKKAKRETLKIPKFYGFSTNAIKNNIIVSAPNEE